MAVTKTIIISAETKKAQSAVDQLTEQLKIQDQVILKLTQDQAFYEAKLASASKSNFAAQKHYNDKLKQTNTELTNEIKARRTLTGEHKKATKAVNQSTKAVKKSSGVMGILNKLTGGLAGSMLSYVATIRKAVVGMKLLKIAMISTGVGAIVVAVASLAAAFSGSEVMQEKFAVGSAILGSIWTYLIDVLAGFGEALWKVITKPQEAWDSFVDAIYTGAEFLKQQTIDRLIARFKIMAFNVEKGVLKMRIAWNKWTLDWKEAKQLEKELKKVNDKINESRQVITDANKSLIDLHKAFVNNERSKVEAMARHAAAQAMAVKMNQKAHRLERQLIVERAKANQEINNIRLQAEDRVNKSAAERIVLLREAQAIEAEITKKEIQAQQLRVDAQKMAMSTIRNSIADKDKLAKLQADLIKLDTKKLRSQRLLQTQITTAINEEIAQKKAANDELEKLEKEHQSNLKAIKEFGIVDIEQIRQAEIDKLTEEYEMILALAKKSGEDIFNIEFAFLDKLTALKDKHLNEDIEVQKAADQQIVDDAQSVADATNAIREAELNNIANGIGALAKLAPKSKALQAASIIASNAVGIAQIVQKTASSNAVITAQGLAGATLSGGQSVTLAKALVAVNKVSAGISIATSIAATAKGLSALKAGGSSGGGGANLGKDVQAPAQAPTFNIVGQGEGNQIASALGQQQQAPIQTYVVSQDITTAQSLENGIIQGATLGG